MAMLREDHLFDADRNAERLNEADPDRPKPRILNDFLTPAFAFLGELGEMRDNNRQ